MVENILRSNGIKLKLEEPRMFESRLKKPMPDEIRSIAIQEYKKSEQEELLDKIEEYEDITGTNITSGSLIDTDRFDVTQGDPYG